MKSQPKIKLRSVDVQPRDPKWDEWDRRYQYLWAEPKPVKSTKSSIYIKISR